MAPTAAVSHGHLEPTTELASPPGRRFTFRSVNTESAFYQLRHTWNELASHAGMSSPFRSWDFAAEWFRTFVKGRMGASTGRFEVVLAEDAGGQLVGLIPLHEEYIMPGQPLLGTTLHPFGRTTSFEPMTDEPIVLFRKGYEEIAARTLREGLAGRNRKTTWDIAVVEAPRAGREPRGTSMVTRRASRIEVTRHSAGPMTLQLPNTWPYLKARLSKSMRDNIAHYPRKLTREVGRWMVREARSPREVADATESLISLHRQRSLSRRGSPHVSHIPSDAHATFLRRLFRRLAWKNQMSIVTIEIRGETIAAQAFVESSECLAVYYSGFNERWYQYSPLTIVMTTALRNAMARGVVRVDFPPISYPWKSRWGASETSTLARTSIYSTSVPSLLRGAARRINWATGARTA